MTRHKNGWGERAYRRLVSSRGLAAFRVVVAETDLWVMADRDLSKETRDAVFRHRHTLEAYIATHPTFREAMAPLPEDPEAPKIVQEMLQASGRCDVGPMAGVAGAISRSVGEDLLIHSNEVVVENGGDIYVKSSEDRCVAIYAGGSPLSLKVGMVIPADWTPLGVCTSSGTVGHSWSYGQADAVCILSKSATLADAAATAVGNRVVSRRDIEAGLALAQEIDGVSGALIIVGSALGVWGGIEMVRI